MKRIVLFFIVFSSVFMMFACGKSDKQFAEPGKGETVADIKNMAFGSIYVRFFNKEAPKAVENFITHAKDGYYDGLTFHRIIEDFMIQGGDPTGTGSGGQSIWGMILKTNLQRIYILTEEHFAWPIRAQILMVASSLLSKQKRPMIRVSLI